MSNIIYKPEITDTDAKIQRMLKLGAKLYSCPNCGNSTPLYAISKYDSRSMGACLFCQILLQIRKGFAVRAKYNNKPLSTDRLTVKIKYWFKEFFRLTRALLK